MKLVKIFVIVGVACLFLVACSEKNPVTTGQVQQSESQAPAQVATSAPETPTEVDGTLTQTEKGLALVTDTDIYVVAGQDLSDMLGKKVKVTGAIAEVDNTQVIKVMSVIPME
jgi:hypothetical protein